MVASIIQLMVLAVVTEAVTEIVVDSQLFSPLRQRFKSLVYPTEHPPKDTVGQQILIFLDKLISCGYCTSVWVAALFALFAPMLIDSWTNWAITTFLLHRMSNCFHVGYELVRKGRVVTHDYLIRISQDSD